MDDRILELNDQNQLLRKELQDNDEDKDEGKKRSKSDKEKIEKGDSKMVLSFQLLRDDLQRLKVAKSMKITIRIYPILFLPSLWPLLMEKKIKMSGWLSKDLNGIWNYLLN